MNLYVLTARMEQSAEAIARMVEGVSDSQARWKSDPSSWSLLEIINHLCDEEREDFRARLDMLLHRADVPFKPIDPEAWIAERGYNERDLSMSVSEYLRERKTSVEWLRGLDKPDWNARHASDRRNMRAGDMLASWIVHDLLHMRQIAKMLWAYSQFELKPFNSDYAGLW